MNTYSNLTAANASKSNSLAKLSSGLRINKAGDDAAGLAISEKMKNQVSGMTQASRNAQDGISLIQTAEGGLKETHSILNRMRDLTVQAANGTNTKEDKGAIQKEITSLQEEVKRIADTTKFNNQPLMNKGTALSDRKITTATVNAAIEKGSAAVADKAFMTTALKDIAGVTVPADETGEALQSLSETKLNEVIKEYNDKATHKVSIEDLKEAGAAEPTTFSFQIGANKAERIDVTINNMTAAGLKIDKINVTDLKQTTDDILGKLDDAIEQVSDQRANLGAVQNRLDHTVSNLATTKENLSEANSRITDVDMAEEMMSFTKSNILSQASTSMLAQANQMPQSVLSLLQ